MDTRLLLISHASTAAMRAARFPANDPLDARGLAEADAARARLSIPDDMAVFVSPAVCARDTASALGLAATVHEGLADMDYGRWHGLRLADLAVEAPQDLAAWTHDPDAAAHGGESFSQLVKRAGQWLDALDDTLSKGATRARDSVSSDGTNEAKNRALSAGTSSAPRNMQHVVAVTHAPVIRAAIVHALGASPDVFSRIEIAPLAIVELRRSRRGWTWWPASQ
ncbi:histidine phosphatase family protein [Paraburkholderia elongata]|uniref:Histidine phosphatase family protein n=1 Tax=Paraburkholderia elongata TaxID=2675747 RepID=A0A972SJ26_9BURK|nr:histidine phosphatase family protein [Paraburkholderia elongata]NPT53100.1 histidine phosphatase family protein [Paraburkholderia elongata]